MARSDDIQREEPQEAVRQSVADILATAREEYGQDLRSVSDALRIRFVYLQAIEDGRFEDLPGLTYAVGFVRSYSDYLGLDTEAIVQQFKEEMGGADKRQQLVFPVPKPEGKIPGGALILISILLAALAYGGWYVLSQDDKSLMELLGGDVQTAPAPAGQPEDAPAAGSGAGQDPTPQDAAPEDAAEEPSADAPEESSVVEEAAETLASTAEEAASTVSERASELSEELLPGEEQGADVPSGAPAAPEDEVESPVDSEGAAVTTETLAPPEETTPNVEVETPDTQTQDAGESGAGVAEDLLEEESARLPDAPETEAVEETPRGEVFGAPQEEPVRVVIEATHDAWVQVFDQDNELLLARVLRAGDRYRVPQGEGMSMLTGNAGGLEVRVDGAPAPSLGPFGEVVRNIALDPVRLLNGTAVGAGSNPQQ